MAWFHSLHLSLLRHDFQASLPRSAVGAELRGRVFGREPLRAIVMHFSTSGRTSLALAIVVMMRPFTLGLLSSNSASRSVRNSALARLRSRAR